MSPASLAALVAAAAGLLSIAKHANAECDASLSPDDTISYMSSSPRLLVDAGCVTIGDILQYRLDEDGSQKGPIYHFNNDTKSLSDVYTGVYYLESSIHIINGGKLSIDGSEKAADGSRVSDECETLLLASNSSTRVNIRAYGGDLDIRYTSIFSWDLDAKDFDRDPSDGRSYLSAVTEKITDRPEDTCNGSAKDDDDGDSTGRAKEDKGNSRMDILRSEIGYLGYEAAESYGISYKARGLCNDLTNLDIFDDDNGLNYGVTGDIKKSNIHHNWFGVYSWGHDGGKWRFNTVHDNEVYGFDPHDDSDKLRIIGNEVYNNGLHGIIASKRCTDLTIRKNVVYGNGGHGIMLHRSCDRATIKENHSHDNVDAGLALYESSDCEVSMNVFEDNKNGVRWSNGANRNKVFENIIRTKEGSEYGLNMFRGSDEQEAEGNEDGHPIENSVYKNEIFTEREETWRMKYADSNVFFKNTFHNGSFATFTYSIDNKVDNNFFPEGFKFEIDGDTCFRQGQDPEC